MERKVPGRIPRILPLVWHRNDMLVHHVEPFAVPRGACGRLHRILAMFRKPFVQVEEEILLAPQHSGQRLPHDESFIIADAAWGYGFVKFIGLMLAGLKDFCEALEEIPDSRRPQIA